MQSIPRGISFQEKYVSALSRTPACLVAVDLRATDSSGRVFACQPIARRSIATYFARKNPRCFSLIGMPVRSITCSRSSQTLRFSVWLALRSR
jgi:hypothetical protein